MAIEGFVGDVLRRFGTGDLALEVLGRRLGERRGVVRDGVRRLRRDDGGGQGLHVWRLDVRGGRPGKGCAPLCLGKRHVKLGEARLQLRDDTRREARRAPVVDTCEAGVAHHLLEGGDRLLKLARTVMVSSFGGGGRRVGDDGGIVRRSFLRGRFGEG